MSDTTTETSGPNHELVAQAARLVAPVSNGTAQSRRVLPVPPPPPSVWTAPSTPLPQARPVRTPAPADVTDLRAWEEAAEQLDADWATPVDEDDHVAEHTAPLAPEVADEPRSEAIKLPLVACDANEDAHAEAGSPSDALALVEANAALQAPAEAKDESAAPSPSADVASQSADAPADAKSEDEESELEALARSVTKGALDSLAARKQAPGGPLPKPPVTSRPPVPPPPPIAASRAPMPPPPPASRTPLPIAGVTRPTPLPVATVTRSTPGPTPLPVATVTRTTLPPLASPRPLPPLTPAPSRPPGSAAFRASPVPPPPRAPALPPAAGAAAGVPRAQLPTLPRAHIEPQRELAAPSVLDLGRSPAARRFYAQLGVAAVFGALLAMIVFALIPGQTTAVSVVGAQPAAVPEAKPAPTAVTRKREEPATRDAIPPPPPVANLSVDDLERERVPAAVALPKAKTAVPSAAADAVTAAPKQAAAPAPAAAPESELAAAPKPEAAAASAKGTLHINAVPPANVAIDGRPLGMTPKIVRLSPGSHRVALIGPGGRRSQTVNVAAGQTATVSVKF
jgi:hypothetical protein